MAALVLVLGGVRSGKSRFAEQLAAEHPPVTYLATAQAGDAEMARRIALHQQRRARLAPGWRTVEEPWNVAAEVAGHFREAGGGCVLLECLTLWLTNLLVGLPATPTHCNGWASLGDAEVLGAVDQLLETVAVAAAGRVIVVSNEAGCGIMPVNDLARRFGDLLGETNQRLARAASEVYVCWAGIPVRIK
jgi:adenosylcobinamide kinase/adenosylcobinamide-phosphate guanylyltransferase